MPTTEQLRLSVLRRPAWPRLLERFASDLHEGDLGKIVVESTLRPVEILELMAADTIAALGDDVLAADRLRTTIHTAWPYGQAPANQPAMIAGVSAAAVVRAAYEPGVLDFGALLLVALGAIRVALPGMAAEFVDVVQGLALSAEFAEVMGRLDPAMPDSADLSRLARAYRALPTGANRSPFARDPVELARKQCIAELFGPEIIGQEVKNAALWRGATSEEITDVRPDPEDSTLLQLVGPFTQLKLDAMAVVFAGVSGEPKTAEVRETVTVPVATPRPRTRRGGAAAAAAAAEPPQLLKVVIPEAAPSGWVGFSIDEDVERSNKHRGEVREALKVLFREHACLRQTAVDPDLIPDFTRTDPRRPGTTIAVPPRTGANRYYAPAGTIEQPPRDEADAYVVLIRPAVLGAEAIPSERATALIRAAAKRAGTSVRIDELPWLGDELALLNEGPGSPESPAVTALIEGMSRTALRTPGAESAIWLALLPDSNTGGWIRSTTAPAARALAVTEPRGLLQLFSELEKVPRPSTTKTRRLRVLGLIGDQVAIEETLEETRAAGTGGPITTEFEAILYGEGDRELSRVPITALSRNPTMPIELLLPISEEIIRVDISHPRLGILKKLPRVLEPPSFFQATLDALDEGDDPSTRTLRWSFAHPLGVPPSITVLAANGELATPAFAVDVCDRIIDLPMSRLSETDALIVVATDGWNRAEVRLELDRFANGDPVNLRGLANRRFYADTAQDWTIEWSLEGKKIEPPPPPPIELDKKLTIALRPPLQTFGMFLKRPQPLRKLDPGARLLQLDARDSGLLQMTAKKSGRVIKEYRRVLGGGS